MIKRKSNFELLRIISIILIISYHYGRHGMYNMKEEDISLIREFSAILTIGGQLGVSIFVLITGYFLYGISFKTERIARLIVYNWYYSILGVIFSIIVLKNISLFELKKSLFPFIYERYWFITSFILLILISPYLNIFLEKSTKKQVEGLIISSVFVWGVLRTVFLAEINYSNVIWFLLLYIIGAYIFKYSSYFLKDWYFYLRMFLLSYIILSILVVFFNIIGKSYNLFFEYNDYLVKITSLPILIISIFLFLAVEKSPIFYNNIINGISSKVISIYLIHDNDLFRNYMWRDILKTPSFQTTTFFYIHFIISILIIILFSVVIDYISKKIILDKLMIKIINLSKNIDKKIKNYI